MKIIKKRKQRISEALVVNKKGKPVKIPNDIYLKFKPYFCDTIKI